MGIVRWTEEELAAWRQQYELRAKHQQSELREPVFATVAPKPNAGAALSAKRARSSEAPDIEGALVVDLMQARLGGFERNYRFDPKRKFELDFAWVAERVAVEVQGGLHSRGAHVRPVGYTRDAQKARRAQLMGWIVLSCTAGCVRDKSIIVDVETALELRRPGLMHMGTVGR